MMASTRGVPDMMIRKLLLPAIAVALLGGCMTSGYSYRQDRGDYYYGQPSTDYRHYGSPYGYGSGYYGGGYYGSGYYSNPYYYGSPYGYHRYPHGYYRPPLVIRPRPDGDHHPGRNDHHDDNRKAPWRDYERLQRERIERSQVVQRRATSVPVRPARALPASGPPVRARDDGDGGSRMERIMHRATDGASKRRRKVEP